MNDGLCPSLEAKTVGVEINQDWIDDQKNDFHKEWLKLYDKVLAVLNASEDGLIRSD